MFRMSKIWTFKGVVWARRYQASRGGSDFSKLENLDEFYGPWMQVVSKRMRANQSGKKLNSSLATGGNTTNVGGSRFGVLASSNVVEASPLIITTRQQLKKGNLSLINISPLVLGEAVGQHHAESSTIRKVHHCRGSSSKANPE
ncbi:hypothetical protein V6N13_048736 [Hibiscus sabdariffa]